MGYQEIGKRIRSLRDDLEISGAELAARVGISRTTLSNYETGKQAVHVDELQSFADALNTTVSYLVSGIDEGSELVARDLRLSNSTIRKLRSSKDQRIQKAVDILVRDPDILPFLYHYFTDPESVFKKTLFVHHGLHNIPLDKLPFIDPEDLKRICLLRITDDLKRIRDQIQGEKAQRKAQKVNEYSAES